MTNTPKEIYNLILASSSPRRQEILRGEGYQFDVIPPDFREPPPGETEDPATYARRISYSKAEVSRIRVNTGLILAADTVVTLNNTIFGKPADESDARRILSTLMGTTHEVITGITLMDAKSGISRTDHARTKVTMIMLDDQELNDYLQSGMWEGKAGAYGVQDRADKYISHLDGSYSNVVGLPMELLREMLSSWKNP